MLSILLVLPFAWSLEDAGWIPESQGDTSYLGWLAIAGVLVGLIAAKSGWSKGTLYHCPFCDVDLWSPSGARKHMKTQDHPVLRWDWY